MHILVDIQILRIQKQIILTPPAYWRSIVTELCRSSDIFLFSEGTQCLFSREQAAEGYRTNSLGRIWKRSIQPAHTSMLDVRSHKYHEICPSRNFRSRVANADLFATGFLWGAHASCVSIRKKRGETLNSSLKALLKCAGLLNPQEYAMSVIELRERAGFRRSSRHRLSLKRRIDSDTDVLSD